MYKVSEVAQIVGVSTAAIYKELKRVDNKFTTIDNGKSVLQRMDCAIFKSDIG